ncbi:putative 5'-3' exoribonuclease 2 isoform X1 [Apostichopus japonicus]|uniref:5'-3' exoribonuclease n=1 Tax=Stichopus japonicus TaxID=307972 RepID=A0A2G8L6G4_STIJA|nr:putative 5'-3' exoribonuclease 2 isoform X1 [Apostichopus japonicus]
MGVPAFFRWLSKTYGNIVVHCVEEKGKVVDGVEVPVDNTKPNPNDVEFDNLYLDMNGIIHPCCHPEDKPAPQSEDEMMEAIFAYIDRLLTIVRPRKLLYMAIDGVAPRAKMNQQRSRRFRASKESQEKKDDMERIKQEITDKGMFLPSKKQDPFHFDSNCITPGTEFMFRLADCLRYYISDRIMNDPAWHKIEVVLSDANTPGEGEHKIMDYIRRQRANPDHDPNTHHCLCGADADLIMLGLATHEPHFTIVREEFKPNQDRGCDLCGQMGHELKNCEGLSAPPSDLANPKQLGAEVQFIFVRLNVLREYIEIELKMDDLPFKFDFERALDDWVFMCFFVGNDFLPHLPSLEIREGAISRLIGLYKTTIHKTKGYLTKDGIVNLERVQLIMNDLGKMEDGIFKKRREKDLHFRSINKRKKMREQAWKGGKEKVSFQRGGYLHEVNKPGDKGSEQSNRGEKRKAEEIDEDEENDKKDEVKLWEDGWRDRYYQSKFGVAPGDEKFRKTVAHAYVRGLCWVLRYYYQGCASWKWYFPYHYAPFACDFVDIAEVAAEFDPTTKPFKPMEQLMSVFPAASGKFLPDTWRELMSDIESPIIDFYPSNFQVDLNGKKYQWQGVALLPFVDEPRMLDTLATVYPNLTEIEKKRNMNGPDRIFVGRHHPLFEFIQELYESNQLDSEEPTIEMNPALTSGVRGKIGMDKFRCPVDSKKESPIASLEPVENCAVASATFRDPAYPPGHLFSCATLPGALFPPKTVTEADISRRGGRGGRWGGRRGRGDFHPRPQLGFTPNSGYRGRGSFSTAPAARMIRNTVGQYSNSPPPGGYGSRSRGQHHRGGNRGSQSWNQDGRQTDSRRGGQWGGGRGKDYGGLTLVLCCTIMFNNE